MLVPSNLEASVAQALVRLHREVRRQGDGGWGGGMMEERAMGLRTMGARMIRIDDARSEDDGSSDSIAMDGNGGTIVKMGLKVEAWEMEP